MVASEHEILRSELRWGAVMGLLVAGILGLIIYAALALHISPPSNVELIDPKTLQLSGEFTEQNLGTQVSGDGNVVVRIVATQYAFLPECVAVPLNRPVTLRLASPDVIHGILISGTNVNTMVVPGFVSPSACHLHPIRPDADAVPRVLRPRPQRDAGASTGAAGGPVQA